jgi:signal transduction histidine kinase
MWRDFRLDAIVTPVRGPANWVFVTYGYGLSLVSLVAFAWLFMRSPPHRWPVVIMLIGQAASRTVYILGALNAIRSELPTDTLVIGIVMAMYAIAMFGFRILDPVPMARQTAIAQMRDGLLVLDPQGRVVSLNPAAQAIRGGPARRIVGRHIQELLPGYVDERGALQPAGADRIEISLGTELDPHHYAATSSVLRDWRGLEIGRLLLLHDATAQREAQTRLVEQQRAQAMLQEREQLARELHDNLGQVFAFVSVQGQTVRRLLDRGDVVSARDRLERLIEIAREADVDIRESILGLRVALSEQGLLPAVALYLAQYETHYGIRTELEASETIADGVFEPLVEVQLLRILQEALTNVRKHAGAQAVRIAFTADGDCARVTVQDDGHGFDPATGRQEPGTHIGLRVMQERAEEVGGSLSIESEPGRGTVVLVRVPMQGCGAGGHGDTLRGGTVPEEQADDA